jgi:hypothetical protein
LFELEDKSLLLSDMPEIDRPFDSVELIFIFTMALPMDSCLFRGEFFEGKCEI